MRQCIALTCLSMLLSVSCTAKTAATDPTGTPDTVILPAAGPLTPGQLAGVPERWQAYLQAVHAADRIVDPLERCLAFPDLPGTHWSREQTAAHCRTHHSPYLPPEEVLSRLGRGDVASVEQTLAAYQRAHQAPDQRSETIHVFYNQLAGAPAADRTTALWLKLAPESPFALTARATYLMNEAGLARGQEFASKTPQAAFDRMNALLAEARPLYEKAIRIAPQSMPARLLAHRAAMLTGDRRRMERSFEDATAVDPACEFLASERMMALRPRWGGSYAEMEAYADTLRAQLANRPRIAQQLVEPLVDRAEVLMCQDAECPHALDEAEALLRQALDQVADESALKDLQWIVDKASLDGRDGHEGVVLSTQLSRFVPQHASYGLLALRLPNDPAWRLQYAERALAAAPEDAETRVFAGDLSFRLGYPQRAESRLGGCADDARFGGKCLQSLVWGWLSTASIPPAERSAHAGPWLDRAQARRPEDPVLWLYRAMQSAYAGDEAGERRALERYDALPEAGQRESAARRAAIVHLIDETLGRRP